MSTCESICSGLQYDRHCSEFFNNQIWRIEDVARVLGVSIGHIYNILSKSRKMRRKDGLPHRKRGKLLYFFPKEVLDWIDKGE